MRLTFLFQTLLYVFLVLSCVLAGVYFYQKDLAAYIYAYDFAHIHDFRESIYAKAQGDRLLRSMVPPDLNKAQEMYHLALTLAPYSPSQWRDYGEVQRQLKNTKDAMKAFQMAEYLDPNDQAVQMGIGNFLMDNGEITSASLYHHRAIQLKPDLATAVYPVYIGLGWTPLDVADKILVNDETTINFFFNDCLAWLKPPEAMVLREGLNDKYGAIFNEETYKIYFDYLIANSEYEAAKLLWNDILNRFYHIDFTSLSPEDDSFWNGTFDHRNLFNGGLEWRIADQMPVECRALITSTDGLQKNKCLRVRFGGKENITFNHVRHFVFIRPGHTYRLKYHAQALDITTDNGPYVRITIMSKQPEVINGRVIQQTGAWNLSQEFYNDSAEWAEITICRDRSEKLSSRIKGDVWFDDFVLESIDTRPDMVEDSL